MLCLLVKKPADWCASFVCVMDIGYILCWCMCNRAGEPHMDKDNDRVTFGCSFISIDNHQNCVCYPSCVVICTAILVTYVVLQLVDRYVDDNIAMMILSVAVSIYLLCGTASCQATKRRRRDAMRY